MNAHEKLGEAARLLRERADQAERIYPQMWREAIRDVRALPHIDSQLPWIESMPPYVGRLMADVLDAAREWAGADEPEFTTALVFANAYLTAQEQSR